MRNILPVEGRDSCDFSQLILSVSFDLRLIRGHLFWGRKSIFTHLSHNQGEGIDPENEENTTFRNFGNFKHNDTASQPRHANILLLLIQGICVSLKSFPTYGVSTYPSALLLFTPRPSLLKQMRKYLRTLLIMSFSCRTPKISRSRSTMFLQFGSKTPLNKRRNLSLSLRRGPWRFWSSLSGSDWLTLASRCLRTLNGRRSEQQQLDKALWGCLLHVRSIWRRGLCLGWLRWLIYSNHLQGLVHRHLCCWTLHTTSWTTL